ncbi:membrane metalloprotease [Robiginitalea sp. SC105]|uniref:membrane metalloprotease n=1 Tax=Robiginitalea sp. SC105 TaxID=2762332 RepID=UPI0016397FE0|nr:membrane metalloprotease [Robiginitalea sp. SC105]MBC2838124.1 membrane metalloprotease [Robiginitalea sp. SC105]
MRHLFIVFAFLTLFAASCSTDAMNDNSLAEAAGELPGYRGEVGESAADLLRGDAFGGLTLQLLYTPGLRPSDQTIQNFQAFLLDRLNKPDGITLTIQEIGSPGQEVYSTQDVRDLEDTVRTLFTTEGNLVVCGIFLDGSFEGNTENGSVLGIAYRNTSFVIFGETLREFSGQPLAPSTAVLESTVLNHEFGHLLGLVNGGTPMQDAHQDTEHGRHCTSEDCLMYWTAETGEGLLNRISGGTIPSLDAACIQDLRANGGK